MRVPCTCRHCGRGFDVKPFVIRNGGGKYCSTDCRIEGKHARSTFTCRHCGNLFQRYDADLRKGGGKYCGDACKYAGREHLRRSPHERWHQYVTVDPVPGVCWDWQGGLNATGYGRIFVRRPDGSQTGRFATHIAWELAAGPIPPGFVICHTCDRPACVRNDDVGWYEIDGIMRPRRGHLWLGTLAENAMDRGFKGRAPRGDASWRRMRPDLVPRGEAISSAKLTESAVRDIRRRYAAGGVRQIDLARRYGVTQTVISAVVLRHTWKHVD
jgi:hypothetical protein